MSEIDPQTLDRIAVAIAEQSQMDYEDAGPKAPHGDIVYHGVLLSSRYDVASEFAHMRRAIDAMPELMARRVESIWCDSKATADYRITLDARLFVDGLSEVVEDAFRSVGGYNGLLIECDGQKAVWLDPYWPGDETEAEDVLAVHEFGSEDDEIPF